MTPRRGQLLPLLLALLASLLLHVAVLLPCLLLAMQLRAQDKPRLDADFDPHELAEDQPKPESEVSVGIETSKASTLNWIGYDTYEKHLALLSVTDQPMLGTELDGPPIESEPLPASPAAAPAVEPPMQAMQPARSATNPAPAPEPAMMPPMAEAPPAPESPAPPADHPVLDQPPGAEVVEAQPHSPPDPAAPERGLEIPELIGALTPLGLSSAAMTQGVAIDPKDVSPLDDPEQQTGQPQEGQPPPPARRDSDAKDKTARDQPKPAPDASPIRPADPTPSSPPAPQTAPSDPSRPAPPPQSPARGRGSPADKEADATTIIDVARDQWQLGKPLSAQGLELKPRRPNFTLLTLLTAAPCNPIARIEFGPDGVPVRAALLKTACDERIDQSVEASLFGWRAAGKPLAELKKDQTIPITIRIILIRPPD